MSTFGLILVILGAGSVTVNLMSLIDRLDNPHQQRRRPA